MAWSKPFHPRIQSVSWVLWVSVICMKSLRSFLALVSPSILLCSMAVAQAAAPALSSSDRVTPQIMPVGELHPGLRGVAYTVFEGTKPEAMEVEILGVLPNLNGPKSDLILARLHGAKVEYTGVVAGMSGSPVYVDGKLVGAISYRIGQFSKEPICGITPASNMLEIDAMDKSAGDWAKAGNESSRQVASPTSGPGLPAGAT